MFRTRVRSDKLALYKMHHSMVWEAVEAGLKAAGLTKLTIWAPKPTEPDQNLLQMYIETQDGVVLGEVTGPGSGYWGSHPDVPAWEELMQSFFEAGEWVEMDEVYNLAPSTNLTGDALVKLKEEIAAVEASTKLTAPGCSSQRVCVLATLVTAVAGAVSFIKRK